MKRYFLPAPRLEEAREDRNGSLKHCQILDNTDANSVAPRRLAARKGGGEQLRDQYSAAGFQILKTHATWPDNGNAVEPGLVELRDLMLEGKFCVFNTCEPFFEEFRLYHLDENGRIVKLNNDILSAVSYAYMMRRYARMMRDIQPEAEREKTSATTACFTFHKVENGGQ